MRATLSTIVICCFDPRVDPAVVAEPGEIGVLRNVGGRVTPRTIDELLMLKELAHTVGSDIGAGWDILVLHHTQCGITLIKDRPDLLTPYFEQDPSGVAVGDPRAAVAHDVAVLRAEPRLPGVRVAGLVYDVTMGLVNRED
jgi:carbonic anhydrase